MTRPPAQATRIAGWLVLIIIAVVCWLCGFGCAVLTVLGV